MSYDRLKNNGKFSKPVISSKMMVKEIVQKILKNVFPNEKNGFKKDLLALLARGFFRVSINSK